MIYTYPFIIGNLSVCALKIETALRLPDGVSANGEKIELIYKEPLNESEIAILDSIMAQTDLGSIPTKGSMFAIDDVLDNRKVFIQALGINCEIYPATAPDSRTFLVFDSTLDDKQKEILYNVYGSFLKQIQ